MYGGYRGYRGDLSRSEAVQGEWTRVTREARYPLNFEANVMVPIMGALAVSVAVVLAVSGVAYAAEISLKAWAAWTTVIFGGVWAFGMVLLLQASFSHFQMLEEYSAEAEEQVSSSTLRLEVVNPGDNKMLLEDLPIDDRRFVLWVRGVMGGRDLSGSTWYGRGGLFSRDEYGALCDYLIRAGLMRWVNPQAHTQGKELTAAGEATLRRFADRSKYILEG